jgi:signal transduction histidine kinase
VKNPFLTKLLGRLNRVGPDNLQNYLLKQEREKGFLETIFNSLQEGIVVIDDDGRIVFANRGAERLLGISEEAIQQPVVRWLRELPWPTLLAEKKSLSRDLEISYPEKRTLNLTMIPLEEASRTEAFALIFRDLTAERAVTRETVESEKMGALTLLAAGVAHELGNPLNSLDIHFQLLERDLRRSDAFDRQGVRESWQVVRSELGRLDTIITNFLRAVRPTVPQLKLDSVNAVLAESIEFLGPEIRDKDIVVQTALDPSAPALWIDRDQLKQAFYNLVKNAVQAMRQGGVLRIRSERTDTDLVITFADDGAGIAPDKIAQVFEPYFTTKPAGSGLGLLIVRRIVREHGGDLQLESHEGRGTTVRVLLPLPERRVRLLPPLST